MRGSVLIEEPGRNSTKFGLRTTLRRRTSASTRRSDSTSKPSRSVS